MIYELTIIAPEVATEVDIEKLTKVIKRCSMSIEKFEDDGVKRLAYSINGHNRGHFLFWELDMATGEPQKLSSELNIKDEVLRYLLVKADTRYRGR